MRHLSRRFHLLSKIIASIGQTPNPSFEPTEYGGSIPTFGLFHLPERLPLKSMFGRMACGLKNTR
jgi:hypothetical protein